MAPDEIEWKLLRLAFVADVAFRFAIEIANKHRGFGDAGARLRAARAEPAARLAHFYHSVLGAITHIANIHWGAEKNWEIHRM